MRNSNPHKLELMSCDKYSRGAIYIANMRALKKTCNEMVKKSQSLSSHGLLPNFIELNKSILDIIDDTNKSLDKNKSLDISSRRKLGCYN